MLLAPDATGRWVPKDVLPGMQTEPGLIVYRFGADLFYANEARFVDEVERLVEQALAPVRHLVVDASATTAIDYSAARSLVRDLIESLDGAWRDGRLRPGEHASALRTWIATGSAPRSVHRGSFATLHEALENVHAGARHGSSAALIAPGVAEGRLVRRRPSWRGADDPAAGIRRALG